MKQPNQNFGSWVRAKRVEINLGLRAFAERSGLDPGNLSKYERGVLPPPQEEDTLTRIGRALEIDPHSEQFVELRDLAAASAGRLPIDIASDEEAVRRMPMLFRAARGEALDEQAFRELLERVRRA